MTSPKAAPLSTAEQLNRLQAQLLQTRQECTEKLNSLHALVEKNAKSNIFFARFFYSFCKPLRILPWLVTPVKGLKVLKDAYLIQKSGRFDPYFYQEAYLEVYAHAYYPLLHYCAYGWHKRYNPARFFCTAVYLQKNPDVLAAKTNPFVHYLRHGQYETFRTKEIGPPQSAARPPSPNTPPLLTRLRFAASPASLTDETIADIRENIQKGLYE